MTSGVGGLAGVEGARGGWLGEVVPGGAVLPTPLAPLSTLPPHATTAASANAKGATSTTPRAIIVTPASR